MGKSDLAWCSVCQKFENRATEIRHRKGQATPHVRAQTSKNPFAFLSRVLQKPEPTKQHSSSNVAPAQPSSTKKAPSAHVSPNITNNVPNTTNNVNIPNNIEDIPNNTDDVLMDPPSPTHETPFRSSSITSDVPMAPPSPMQRNPTIDQTHWRPARQPTVEDWDSGEGDDDEDDDDTVTWDEYLEAEDDDPHGALPATDMIDEDFERELAEIAEELSEEDFEFLRAFALKIDEHLTLQAFEKLKYAFPKANINTWKNTKSRVEFLAALRPVPYDCCTNSCCCFVGPHASANMCTYCQEPRFDSRGRPRKRFIYIPLISRLVEHFKNADMVERMKYRAEFVADPHGGVKDVFDGSLYRSLKETFVEIDGKVQPYRFFSDDRDIALGLSTDGFAPFKRRKHTAWPLIVFNYNLPPEIRFHLRNIMCVGIIPGPKKPKDFDSFLWPLVEDLLSLSTGVRAFDTTTGTLFPLRAYLLLVFGDMPAISMVMRMKGHNGIFPCRSCKIQGLRVPNSRGTTHYVPLNRSEHPSSDAAGTIPIYDPLQLPLRTHAEILTQAHEVQSAPTEAEAERLSKSYGVKGVPLLSCLSSLSFPQSFPLDFMHLMYENNVKNLVLLYTGKYKDLDEGTGSYHIDPKVWESIGLATAASGSTIPTAFGARPHDVASDKAACTADMWSFWTLYLGPVLLYNKFPDDIYYDHFIELVKLIHVCLQFELTAADISCIRDGFAQWVKDYEKLFYQYSPERLPTCPLTLHALLHIADSIKEAGPVWAYWAFPMERFCGRLQPTIKSRRHPYASMDTYAVANAQLSLIKIKYKLVDELSLREPQKIQARGTFRHDDYPSCELLPPSAKVGTVSLSHLQKIVIALSTRYDVSQAKIRKHIQPNLIQQWGKVRRFDGDTMHANSLVQLQDDSRDATFVRYDLLVDKYARNHGREPEFEVQSFYGQLENIFVVPLPATPDLDLTNATSLILVAIHSCTIIAHNDLDMHYYKKLGRVEVVDMTSVQCLVGRVKDGNKWAIIDRSGNMARGFYDPDV